MPILATKRPEPQPTPPPKPAALPETIDECERALASLDTERAALRAQIDALPTREADAIKAGADDSVFDQIDADKRRLRRALARLEAREQPLVDRAAQLQAVADDAAWSAAIADHREAMEDWCDIAEQLNAAAARVCYYASDGRAARLFPPGGSLAYPPAPIDAAVIRGCRAAVAQHRPRPRWKVPTLFIVRFTRSWYVYMCNDQAGFPRERAEWLVAQGFADMIGRARS